MRFKKQKRHRRTVRFFTVCCGFREPFKVLCDGTFVHHLLANNITPADTALSNILSGTVKVFTTSCVLAELRSLGASYSASLNAASNLITARCDHEKRKSAVACITEVIGENNPEHFFVATQDADLRKKFQEIPGVPVIFGLRNMLLLEPPSALQLQFAKSAEEERLHMTKMDYERLKIRKMEKLAAEGTHYSSDANEGLGFQSLESQALQKENLLNRTDVKDKGKFKRKRAKGPNPLSCKKKSHVKQNSVPEKHNKDGEKTMRSRSRKRKRSRKDKVLPNQLVNTA